MSTVIYSRYIQFFNFVSLLDNYEHLFPKISEKTSRGPKILKSGYVSMTDLFKFVQEWADFDKNTEYLFGYLHPTVSCCIPDPQLKITKFKIQLQLQN